MIAAFVLLAFVAVAANIRLPQGYKLLSVQSGSMEPTIGVGSLVLTKPLPDYVAPVETPKFAAGDVVTFSQHSSLVSHRVVEVVKKDAAFFYRTKGDANKDPDGTLISEKNIVGKVALVVPFLGKMITYAKQPLGYFLLIVIPCVFLIFNELLFLFSELRKRGAKAPASGVAMPVLLLFAAGYLFVGGTKAFFSDTATSTNNIFSAAESFGTDHLVISEVQINGANANQDFVEIYNPTDSAVDLEDWQIRKRTSNGTDSSLVLIGAGESIPAHGFFLWSNDQGTFETVVGADVSNGNNLSENNSVALEDPADNVIDQVAWGIGTSQFVEGTAITNGSDGNSSVERKALSTSTSVTMGAGGVDEFKGNGFDANNNATDFYLRAVSQPQNSGSATESP